MTKTINKKPSTLQVDPNLTAELFGESQEHLFAGLGEEVVGAVQVGWVGVGMPRGIEDALGDIVSVGPAVVPEVTGRSRRHRSRNAITLEKLVMSLRKTGKMVSRPNIFRCFLMLFFSIFSASLLLLFCG